MTPENLDSSTDLQRQPTSKELGSPVTVIQINSGTTITVTLFALLLQSEHRDIDNDGDNEVTNDVNTYEPSTIEGILMSSCVARNDPAYVHFMSVYQVTSNLLRLHHQVFTYTYIQQYLSTSPSITVCVYEQKPIRKSL